MALPAEVPMNGGDAIDVDAYLARLGVTRPPEPSLAALFALHRAHVERVPWQTVHVVLGRRTSIDPAASAAGIIAGHGGYCFHLNGAFAALLRHLGYRLTLHRAGVQIRAGAPPRVDGFHVAIVVRDLPAPQSPAGEWLVDVGLGDALYEPLPLLWGDYPQAGLLLRLTPSCVAPGGWRLLHDARAGVVGVDIAPEPVSLSSFTAAHEELSASPHSGWRRLAVVERRHAQGADILRGCIFTRLGAATIEQHTVTDRARWFSLLSECFDLHFTESERTRLWAVVWDAHQRWQAEQPKERPLPEL